MFYKRNVFQDESFSYFKKNFYIHSSVKNQKKKKHVVPIQIQIHSDINLSFIFVQKSDDDDFY